MPVRLVLAAAFATASILALSAQQPQVDERFYHAIRNDDSAALGRLVREVGPNEADTSGHTPLMLAAALGTPEAVQFLLSRGADPNLAGIAGATPLHLAVQDVRKVRLLLDVGADVRIASRLGRTPLLVAASVNGSLEVVRLLLEKGGNVNAADNTGVTPIIAAAAVDDLGVARLLLEHGADPNAGEPVPARYALSAAASHGNAELVRLLLASGADVDAHTSDHAGVVKNGPIQFGSVTALHSAVLAANPDVVSALLDAGAMVDALDIRGMTPLMWAVANDRPEPSIIRMLREHGADVSRRSNIDESTLDWARKFNNPTVLGELGLEAAERSAVSPELSESHTEATPREAVERAMPLLRLASGRVMTDGGCVACHAQPMSAIGAELAASRGWRVERADADAAQATMALGAVAPSLLQAQEGGGRPDSQLFTTTMMATLGMPPRLATDALAVYMAGKQLQGGNWHVVGGTRAPIQDGDFLRTAMAIQALAVYGAPALATEFASRVDRAAGWLAGQTPITTQDRIAQLLGLKWAGADAPLRDTRLRELLALQRPDGGWAQTPYLESDAYATGQVLYTLHELGVPAPDRVRGRATAFLLGTQRDDGSWYVRNRAMKLQPYFESGFPYGHDQWISQTGTSWAVIGLSVAGPEGLDVASSR